MSTDTLSIVTFGAKPNTLCTGSIQAAIDQAGSAGGGTVLIPPGRWISGTLVLRSGVTLLLPPGAVLQGSPYLGDYIRRDQDISFDDQRHHLLLADRVSHIKITGGGIIDGNGMAFWDVPKAPSPWYRERDPRVHPMLELRSCQHVVFDDITIANSPGWTVHLNNCDSVIMHAVQVRNHLFGPNTDGFDINGCRDVFISNCHLVCGDDCIIIKAGKRDRASERIMINNCVTESNCIGIGLGCETASDIRQVAISNCVMTRCHRMFAIGMWDGGIVEDVTVTGCVGDTLLPVTFARPIHIDVKQHVGSDEPIGTLRNIQISNFIAKTRGRILLTCQNPKMLDNVLLRDIRLDYPEVEDPEIGCPQTPQQGSAQFSNYNQAARQQRSAFVAENIRGLRVENLAVHLPEGLAFPFTPVWLRNTPKAYVSLADGTVISGT